MKERPIEGMMGLTLEKLKEMIGSDTIVGDPMVVDGATIIPVSKVTFGFASGGSDFGARTTKELFGGGGGGGVTVTPIAFLVVKDGNVRTIQLADSSSALDRAITMMPELVDKLNEFLATRKQAQE